MKATQGHRAAPLAPATLAATQEDTKLRAAWTTVVTPTTWDARLIASIAGQIEQATVAGGTLFVQFLSVCEVDKSYRAEVRAVTGGEPGPWLVSNTVLFS